MTKPAPAPDASALAEEGLDGDGVPSREEERLERIRSESFEDRASETVAGADQAAAERLHRFYETRRAEVKK